MRDIITKYYLRKNIRRLLFQQRRKRISKL